MNKNKKFISPRMEIIDHYDLVINELDIYTEVLLEKSVPGNKIYVPQYFKKENFIENAIKFDNLAKNAKDEYSFCYEYEQTKVPVQLPIEDFINGARKKAIVELETVRKETLEYYDANKKRFERDWSKMVDSNEREMFRQDVFGNKFCFGIEIEATEREYSTLKFEFDRNLPKILPNPTFKFCTVVADFYLSENEIKKLRKLMNDPKGQFQEKSILNEKTVLLNLIDRYVWRHLAVANFGNEVIFIEKAKLFSTEALNLNASCEDESNHLFEMPLVKSLELFAGTFFNFDVFPNLRHLYWKPELNQNVVTNFVCQDVNVLHTLKIYSCGLSQMNTILENLTCLEVLQINLFRGYIQSEKIQFDLLVNLKYLCLHNFNSYSIKQLKNLVNLKLYSCKLEENCFEGLSNLESLFLCYVNDLQLPTLKHLNKLKELSLPYCDISAVDFSKKNEFLPNLTFLNLLHNKIEVLNEGIFSSLKSLKMLFLYNNLIRKLDKNVFNGLGKLEYLALNGNPLDNVETTLADLRQINESINVHF